MWPAVLPDCLVVSSQKKFLKMPIWRKIAQNYAKWPKTAKYNGIFWRKKTHLVLTMVGTPNVYHIKAPFLVFLSCHPRNLFLFIC